MVGTDGGSRVRYTVAAEKSKKVVFAFEACGVMNRDDGKDGREREVIKYPDNHCVLDIFAPTSIPVWLHELLSCLL